MSKRKRKNVKEQVKKYEYNCLSQNEMIEIQAEAYYRAMKKIELEKIETKIPSRDKKIVKWYVFVLFMLNVIFFPWKISKKFSINDRIYDSVLVLFVSMALQVIGSVMWLVGLGVIIYIFYKIIIGELLPAFFVLLLIAVVVFFFGSILVLAGDKFSQEMDSQKIYAYSASVIAMISCVASIIALLS